MCQQKRVTSEIMIMEIAKTTENGILMLHLTKKRALAK